MSTAFTGFVLLNEAKFDRDKFLKDLKEDWKITLDLSKEDESKEKDMLVGDINGIMVAVALMPAPIPNPNLVEGAKLYTKIISALIKQENCTGINVLGTVLNPDMYRDFTRYYEENDMFPVENMIFIGLYGSEEEKINAYTYGMEGFGKKEMEILFSSQSPEDVYYFLQGVADYVITSDVILQDGETIGFSAEQKIPISQSKGIAVNGITLKLGY